MTGKHFTPVRTGVIGLGRFGKLHALTLAGLAEAELAGIVARRPESLREFDTLLPGVPGWTDLDRAIAESDAEAWIVACTTAAHVDVTRRLLKAGKTVLLEKPISGDLEEARSLEPLIEANSANLMIGHIVLFNSEFLQLCDEAQTRGPISYIDCVRHRPASIVKDFAGENPLHAAMVHDLYATQVLVQRAEPSHFSLQYHRTPTGAIDLASARLSWDNGPVATFAASYLTPSGMPPRGFDRMEVFGDGWASRISPNPRPIELWSEQAEWPMALEIRADPAGASGMMAEEQRRFCRVVRGLQPVPVGATYGDAIQVQEWMDRLERSGKGPA
ncbi:MAG: Gfo/Idh/MocA family oxidoreductase [Planctomycetota bacterium]|nr:Gfo/Idh/MocA family oxidoreductase [Planctomycetota bacterium]